MSSVEPGISADDGLFIPHLTFIATAHAVIYIGATIVTVDTEPDTLCICPQATTNVITPKTKAIILVHLYGHPANMEVIFTIAGEHGLIVVEDAAEAHGAEINNQKAVGLGPAGIFSFYGNKVITSAEGGMITAYDQRLYHRMRYLRDHAMPNDIFPHY